MKALVLQGEVVQVEEQEFEVHPSLKWVEIPEGMPVSVQWRYDGKGFLPPLPVAPGTGGKGGSGIGGDINIGGKGGDGIYGGDGGHGIGDGINIGAEGGRGYAEEVKPASYNWTKIGAVAAVVSVFVAILGIVLTVF